MALLRKCLLLGTVAAFALALPILASAQGVILNEIRIDQTGSDADEYVELAGAPTTSLNGYWLVVIGDGTGACGTIESVVDFTGYAIQADGYAAFTDSDTGTDVLVGYDYVLAGNGLNFENGDNVTFLLVTGFTGANGDDLDTDDDGVLDVMPWGSIVDEVGLDEGTVVDCATNEYLYTSTTVGPDGSFVPGHVYRCGSGWEIGVFDPTVGVDTPGAANSYCPVPVENSTWGQIKGKYRTIED